MEWLLKEATVLPCDWKKNKLFLHHLFQRKTEKLLISGRQKDKKVKRLGSQSPMHR